MKHTRRIDQIKKTVADIEDRNDRKKVTEIFSKLPDEDLKTLAEISRKRRTKI